MAQSRIQTNHTAVSAKLTSAGTQKKEENKLDSSEARKYTGKAGEYLVLAELLFRGYNAQIMAVDSGLDIVATKRDRLFLLQVKTTKFASGGSSGQIKLSEHSYIRTQGANMFYIFVLQQGQQRDFLILTFSKIRELITEGIVSKPDSDSKGFKIKIIRQDSQYYVNKKVDKADVSKFLNDWDQLI